MICFHVYHILFIGDTQLVEVFVIGFGTDGLPHIKPQLKPQTRDHLERHKHTAGWKEVEVFPLPFPPSCRSVSTCLVAGPTLWRVNRWVELEMELYFEMETERGTLMSSEFSSMSSGQPRQGALSGVTWSTGEEKDCEQNKNKINFMFNHSIYISKMF